MAESAIEIRPVGSVLAVDEHGFFINPCAPSRIEAPWQEVVEAAVASYREHLGGQLHSVYVRGSVARGEAVEGVSDIDMFAVLHGPRFEANLSWIDNVQRRLDQRFAFQTGVELQVLSKAEALAAPNRVKIGFVIKTLAACVWGSDLAPSIAPFRPGPFLAQGVHDLAGYRDKGVAALSRDGADTDRVARLCQWLMKSTVRTGFLLVAERERTYTRDLYPGYEAFARHYPARKADMRQALEWALNPCRDAVLLSEFLNGFVAWLCATAAQLYPPSAVPAGLGHAHRRAKIGVK